MDVFFITTDGSETPIMDDFFLFSKNAVVNTSGVLGFFANVTLTQVPFSTMVGNEIVSTIPNAELFSINTEQFQSSN